MNNTIVIEVSEFSEPSCECIPVGGSGEHNAAILKFLLSDSFTGEYRYYLEFTLPNTKSFRTDFIELDSDNALIFAIPASLTVQSCVDCCLNAVKVEADGTTSQLLKPKSVTLLFSPLYDSNGEILENYDFSVNTLLQNIKNGVFKGDSYLITEEDKKHIADEMFADYYDSAFKKSIPCESSGSAFLAHTLSRDILNIKIKGVTQIVKPDSEAPISPDNIAEYKGKNSLVMYIRPTDTKFRAEDIIINLKNEIHNIDTFADIADSAKGTVRRKIEPYTFTGYEDFTTMGPYTSGDVSVNGLLWRVPQGKEMISSGSKRGVCSHFENTIKKLSNANLGSIIADNDIYLGTFFYVNVLFYTQKTPEEFIAFLKTQYENGTPVKVYYILKDAYDIPDKQYTISLNPPSCEIFTDDATKEIEYTYFANISSEITEIESRLSTESNSI